ncbi:DUF1775 domain-containing protein [Myxococcus stipitatus]|uniref:DUF1775 domain-containing protein n=1 Tax=Myxococcus stipitatus TaxID=83455 RepID=UPI0031456A3C
MKSSLPTLFAVASLLAGTAAHAHISVTGPGPAVAGTTYDAQFTISHGCGGADTYRVTVRIPAGVTSVRPLDSTFGKATVEKDGNGQVTSITWTRGSASDVLPADTHAHRLSLRARLPDAPFTTVYFPTTQVCRDAQGKETTVEWVGTSGHGGHGGADSGSTPQPEPAPELFVYPARTPGWNKYTVEAHVHDFSVFRDALIVWAGDSAYSPNPVTKALIETEAGTKPLTEIHPGTEIWVKY